MPNKTVQLVDPINTHDGKIAAVEFRPPTATEYWDLGDPVIWAQNPDGSLFPVENSDLMRRYIQRLCVVPKDPLLLEQMSLADGMAVKAAVHDFFSEARSASIAAALRSSGTSDGAQKS